MLPEQQINNTYIKELKYIMNYANAILKIHIFEKTYCIYLHQWNVT